MIVHYENGLKTSGDTTNLKDKELRASNFDKNALYLLMEWNPHYLECQLLEMLNTS